MGEKSLHAVGRGIFQMEEAEKIRPDDSNESRHSLPMGDDDCFYYHSWRNNVVIAFGTLSFFRT